MNISEAQEQAATGKAVHYSTNGGRKRYLRFRATLAHRDGAEGIITAVAYGKPIAIFTAEGVRLDSWGHRHSITTREAMNYCLSSPGFVHSRDNVIYAGGQPFTDGMVIPYREGS